MRDLLVLALLFVPVSMAQAASWKVIKVKGEVERERHGEVVELKKGDLLELGDFVITKRRARVRLQHGDHKFWLGSRSRFKVRTQNEAGSSKGDQLHLIYGQLRAQVDPVKAKKDQLNYKVKTRTAVAGVRGTEFFVSSDEDSEKVCTIHGRVRLEYGSNQSVDIPACAGVSLSSGQVAQLQPMDSKVIGEWVQQTSVDAADPVIPLAYEGRRKNWRKVSDNLIWSLSALGTVGHVNRIGYGSTGIAKQSNSFVTAKILPTLQWGKKDQLVWSPRWLLAHSDERFRFDSSPVEWGHRLSQVDGMGELYIKSSRSGHHLTLGVQKLHWNDGFLLGDNLWTLDSHLFPALRWQTDFHPYFVDFFVTTSGKNELYTGQEPAKLIGTKVDYMAWASLFALHRIYDESTSNALTRNQNHKVTDFGIFSSHQMGSWDYRLHISLQSGEIFSDQSSKRRTVGESQRQLDMGYYPIAGTNLRLGLSYLIASKDYLPGFEANYLLGYSQLVSRTNLEQKRLNVHYAKDDWTVKLDYIQNHSLEAGASFSSWSGDGVAIANEFNLISSWSCGKNTELSLALIQLQPKDHLKWAQWDIADGHGAYLHWQMAY